MFQLDYEQESPRRQPQHLTSYIELTETNEMEEVMRKYVLNQKLQPDQGKCTGIVGSYSNRMDSISLGRLQHADRNFIFIGNELVSRAHCRIFLVKNDRYPKLSNSFLRFLACRQYAYQESALHKLPNNAVRLIFDYASDVHGYHIVDQGSRNGTYLQIRKWRTMSRGQVYALAGSGERYEMKVNEILNNPNGWDVNFKRKVDELLDKANANTKFIPSNPKSNPNKYNLSYLKISIKIEGTDTEYIITSETKYVTMGLNCMINLTDPSVPYTGVQSSLKYDKVWSIKDGGEDNVASMFGTWLKLQLESVKLSDEQTIKLGFAVRLDFRYGLH